MLRRTAGLLVAAIALVLATAGTASAHPLGNFTVNHYAGIELAGDRVYVRYVLDLAEIPTFQFGDDVRAAGFAATVARSLELRLDGRRVVLRPVAHRVVARRGAGGLKTLRFDAVFSAAASGRALTFADRLFPSRIGWREITIAARDGARLLDASVPSASRSNELRSYPDDLLRSPLDVRSAVATFEPGTACRPCSGSRARARPEPSRPGLRGADRARRAVGRRRPAVAARRRVLGRRARAHTRPRQGARRGVPGGDARAAAPCVRARRDGDRDAHGRRLRARPRDAPSVALHRPRAALSRGSPWPPGCSSSRSASVSSASGCGRVPAPGTTTTTTGRGTTTITTTTTGTVITTTTTTTTP